MNCQAGILTWGCSQQLFREKKRVFRLSEGQLSSPILHVICLAMVCSRHQDQAFMSTFSAITQEHLFNLRQRNSEKIQLWSWLPCRGNQRQKQSEMWSEIRKASETNLKLNPILKCSDYNDYQLVTTLVTTKVLQSPSRSFNITVAHRSHDIPWIPWGSVILRSAGLAACVGGRLGSQKKWSKSSVTRYKIW